MNPRFNSSEEILQCSSFLSLSQRQHLFWQAPYKHKWHKTVNMRGGGSTAESTAKNTSGAAQRLDLLSFLLDRLEVNIALVSPSRLMWIWNTSYIENFKPNGGVPLSYRFESLWAQSHSLLHLYSNSFCGSWITFLFQKGKHAALKLRH